MPSDKEKFNDVIKKRLLGLDRQGLLKVKSRLVKLYLNERDRVLKSSNEKEMHKIDDDYQRKLTEINKAILRLKFPARLQRSQKKKS